MEAKKVLLKKVFIICISIVFTTLIISGCSIKAQEKEEKEEYLLNTQWNQTDSYAKFCPDNYRAGCWSTAMAQIMYFHKIAPTGKVDYETSTKYKISENLDSYQFNWDLFVEKIDDRTSEESTEQVAKYTYFTSIVLEKDFASGTYQTVNSQYKDGISSWNIDDVITNLNSHFNCKAKDYHYTKEELVTCKDTIIKLIKEEIDSNRPIMLYIQSNRTGHATVIDGYCETDDKFLVHINQGNGGWGNKWYDFNQPILEDIDDLNHRILITIQPPTNNKDHVSISQNKKDYLLETQWTTEGHYTKFCPDNEILGHWTIALAQILSYHKFQPKGEINYETSSGLNIKENLDSYKFDWDLFVERLDAKASSQSIDQVAKYNYYTEVVLEKDFGSKGYKTIFEDESNTDINGVINNINKFFNCSAEVYEYSEEEIIASKDKIIALIKTEIDNKRPLLFYTKPYSAAGNVAVIDGYVEENNEFFVHINTGMDGYYNQWYKLSGPMSDMKYWILMTIE